MVSMKEIQDVGQRIAFEFRPQRIILFGSHARGTAGEHSDVDLLVIMRFEGTGFRHPWRFSTASISVCPST